MPRPLSISSIKARMPVRYRFHPLIRWVMIAFTALIAGYSIYFLVRWVNADTPMFFKITPLVILYIGLDSLFRHLTALNEVIFTPECLWLRFIIKPAIPIPWDNLRALQLQKRITYYLYIGYTDLKGQQKLYKTPASFPKMTEILYNIADLAPQVEMNEELAKMVAYLREIADKPETS